MCIIKPSFKVNNSFEIDKKKTVTTSPVER